MLGASGCALGLSRALQAVPEILAPRTEWSVQSPSPARLCQWDRQVTWGQAGVLGRTGAGLGASVPAPPPGLGIAGTGAPQPRGRPEPGWLSHLSPQVSLRAVPVPEDVAGTERAQDTLESLLAWVADMEELVSNQKPPSSEVKVAKAQLEEQKVGKSWAGAALPLWSPSSRGLQGWGLGAGQPPQHSSVPCPLQLLKRLLEERRPRVEHVLQERAALPGTTAAAAEGSSGLSSLGEKWGKLMQEAEARWVRAEAFLSGVSTSSPVCTGAGGAVQLPRRALQRQQDVLSPCLCGGSGSVLALLRGMEMEQDRGWCSRAGAASPCVPVSLCPRVPVSLCPLVPVSLLPGP